jgi:predicted small integral membrane protein
MSLINTLNSRGPRTDNNNNNNIIIIIIPNYQLSWVLLEKPPVEELLKNFSTSRGDRRFIKVLKSAAHWCLFWASLIQPIPPQNLSLRSILIWYSHLLQGLLSSLFLEAFPLKLYMHSCSLPCVLYVPTISSTFASSFYLCLAKSSSHEVHHYAVSSVLLSLKPSSVQIFSSAHCSHTSTLNVTQVSHPYKTTRKIILLYILIFNFSESTREEKVFPHSLQQALITQIRFSLISS